jgi:hypothetical protein
MASLVNGGLPTRLGFHKLNTEERGASTATRKGWADRPGPFLALFWLCFLHALSPAFWMIGPFNCGLWTSLSPRPSWGIFMHELPVFSSRSSGVLHSSTLVLATSGGKFAHGRSSLIVLQNVLWTSCIFPHLIHEFLQKHYTPKCTSNGELVISLVSLVAG